MKSRRYVNKNTLFVFVIIICITVFLKLFLYKLMPLKYFYDSLHILGTMNGTAHADGSYLYVANIFNKINIFKFSTMEQWSWFITIIFFPIIIYIIDGRKKYSIYQYIFISANIILLDIYVLGLSKDIIQFIYFLVIYIILSKNWKNTTKLILSCMVLLYEALNFRIYYAIMAMIMVTIYYIYIMFIKNKEINKRTGFKIISLSLLFFFIEVFIVQLISTDNYISILHARSNVNLQREHVTDTVTMIKDWLGINTNYFKFIGNYIINVFRIMIPIELLFKGVKYIPFIVYQIFITLQIVKSCKKMNDKNILWIITTIAFLMVSIIFEPDFGSFIRHESALSLILLQLTNINYEKGENELDKNIANRYVK